MSRAYETTLTVRCGRCGTTDGASPAATSGQEAAGLVMSLLRHRGWHIPKGGRLDHDRCPACARSQIERRQEGK